jgi:ferric-dicitrate binding protein FerR (iron transport regulator)
VSSSTRIYQLFSRIAVVILIPALVTVAILSWLLVFDQDQTESWAEIHSPIGTRTQFQLPDGTKGWLNSGSSIKYPVNFKKRSVEVSGEAWFDVVHRKSDEFRVITPFFDVRVLGTRFNVISYDHEKTAEVILEKGKVQVLGKNRLVQGELSPDEHFVYDKTTGKAVFANIDSKTYTSWKDGWLIFKNVPMTEIARRLERKYNAEIMLHGDSLKSSIFRATFQDESLEEICRLLSAVAPIRYNIHQREKQPDGTFTKSKIEMWLK